MGHFLQITITRKTLPFLKKNIQFSMIANFRNGHFLQITTARKTRPFLKKNYTISRDHKLQKWATFCKLRLQEKLNHFSRKTIQFLLIANCRIGPLSANYDRKKNCKISQEKPYKLSGSRIAEKSHFLQITIARKTRPFLKKNHTISRDRELQKWATFCKLRSQEKLYNFSGSRIAKMGHFLQITIVRKTIKFLKKSYTKFS